MKKKSLKVLAFATLAFIPVCLFSTGCSIFNTETVSIESIEKTDSQGLIDTYTITFTDGTTKTFTVTNGKNGEDGKDGESTQVSVEDLFNEYKNIYGEDLTYSQFLEKYLAVNIDETKTTKAINKALLSNALVYSEFYEKSSTVGTSFDNNLYSGSAVIWQMDEEYTYFVTNYHVIYSSKAYLAMNETNFAHSIKVYLYGSSGGASKSTSSSTSYDTYVYTGSYIDCEYIGGSASNDLAVIRAETSDVNSVNSDACKVELADEYHIGETAIAIGNAEGEGISVTQGIVSVDSESVSLDIDKQRSYREMRIDTAIYHGNSGGGLFNSDGKLIGITNAGDETDQNINYAIPLNVVKGMVENIMYYCKDSSSTTGSKILLGITVQSDNVKYSYDSQTGYGTIVEDINVTNVSEGSIAEKMGLKTGDRITAIEINGKDYTVFRSYDIGDLLLTIRVNDNISIKYMRGNTEATSEKYKVILSDLITIE